MAKERDEYGEVKTNKAGDADFTDKKTFLLDEKRKTDPAARAETDTDEQVEAEKTRPIWGKKKPKVRDKAETEEPENQTKDEASNIPCVGWVVVWDGPGQGTAHVLRPGLNKIGREESCEVVLSYGDSGISNKGLIGIGYDRKGHSFAVVNLGSTNPLYLNDAPIWNQSELTENDKLLIGETTLVFVPFCNQDRNWG